VIRENLARVRERIHSACANAGRNPQDITVVAVGKRGTLRQIEEVIAEGINNIGESRVQEAFLKYNALRPSQGVIWHMVGRLQTNKVKAAVGIFDLIHSLDSLRLASEINRQAQRLGKVQDVLVEIKTSPEEAKSGLRPDEALEAIRQMSELKNINIQGLMTIAPMTGSQEEARTYFRRLRELRDRIASLSTVSCRLSTLSMGMSDDFQIAIEEGATMVRLGRAIFEGLS
jgi:PLP dependent protein